MTGSPIAGPDRPSPTLSRLGALVAATVAALVLLFGALAVTIAGARDGLQVIGHDAGPQVIATTDLYFALSDADGQLAGALLAGGAPGPGRQAALDRYQQRRAEVGEALLAAHQLAAGNPAQQRTIGSILAGFGRYEQLAARTLLLSEQSGHPPGQPPEAVLAGHREATDVMSLLVLPQAYNLTLESGTAVREGHDRAAGTVATGRVVVAIAGLLALASLGWLQLHLVRRFRRVFNPALLVATAVAGLYAFTGVTVLNVEADALQLAKQDGFDSVLSLARARAISNSLHADQVRYQLDPVRADTYEQLYLDKAQALIYVEAGNLAEYQEAVAGYQEAVAGYQDAVAGLAPADQLTGLLGGPASQPEDAGRDGTLATAAVAAYHDLQQADRRLRDAAADPDLAGGPESRSAGAAGAAPAGLDQAFQDYDAALIALTDTHRTTFESAVADGEAAMAGLGFLLPVAMISIAVLVVAGVAPRAGEYR